MSSPKPRNFHGNQNYSPAQQRWEFYVLRMNELIPFSQCDLPPKNFRKHQSKESQVEEMIFFSFFLRSPLRSVARLIHKWQFNKNSPLFLPLKFLFTSHYYIVYSSCPLKFLKYPFYTWSFMLLTSQEFESEFPSFGPCFHGILANGDRCICPLLSRNFLPWGFQI